MEHQEQAEILQLGETALTELQQAYKYLDSASNWGIASAVTNGLLFVSKKYDLLEKANHCIETAKGELKKITDILQDEEIARNLNLNPRDFLEFDNMFYGYAAMSNVVTDRINEARGQVKKYIGKLEGMLNAMKQI